MIDTPGLHQPRTLLGGHLSETVRETQSEVDVAGACPSCDQWIGPDDRYTISQIAELSNHLLLVAPVTRTDLVSKKRALSHLADISTLTDEFDIQWTEVIPCSTLGGGRVGTAHDVSLRLLPEGPTHYPDGEVTDEPEGTLIAELAREAALEGIRDELPRSITMVIDEVLPRPSRPEDKPLLDAFTSIVVERDSQKGIIIGHKESRLREIGIATRPQVNRLLDTSVHLGLRVKVLREWQHDMRYLNRLGFQQAFGHDGVIPSSSLPQRGPVLNRPAPSL